MTSHKQNRGDDLTALQAIDMLDKAVGRKYFYIYTGPTRVHPIAQDKNIQSKCWVFGVHNKLQDSEGNPYSDLYMGNHYETLNWIKAPYPPYDKYNIPQSDEDLYAISQATVSVTLWNRQAYGMSHRTGSRYTLRKSVYLKDKDGVSKQYVPAGDQIAIDGWQGYDDRLRVQPQIRCDGYYHNGVFHETSGLYCPLNDNDNPAVYNINTY